MLNFAHKLYILLDPLLRVHIAFLALPILALGILEMIGIKLILPIIQVIFSRAQHLN